MSPKATVLVIEDDPAIQELVKAMLRFEGYRIVSVPNGLEGLNQVTQSQPDIIILDIGMPVMDGKGFIAAYHDMPGDHAPIVATSAYSVDPTEIRGIAGFIKKPFDLARLLGTVEGVLKRYAHA